MENIQQFSGDEQQISIWKLYLNTGGVMNELLNYFIKMAQIAKCTRNNRL